MSLRLTPATAAQETLAHKTRTCASTLLYCTGAEHYSAAHGACGDSSSLDIVMMSSSSRFLCSDMMLFLGRASHGPPRYHGNLAKRARLGRERTACRFESYLLPSKLTDFLVCMRDVHGCTVYAKTYTQLGLVSPLLVSWLETWKIRCSNSPRASRHLQACILQGFSLSSRSLSAQSRTESVRVSCFKSCQS